MSNITTIFDAINTRLDSIYSSTHKHLANPYDLEFNDDKFLSRGYAWYFSDGENSEKQLSCGKSIKRNIVFILTVANRGTDRDRTIRQTAEKQLLEDLYLIFNSLETAPQVSDKISVLKYVSDSGIEQIYTENNNFLSIRCTFEVHYIEEY